MGIIGKYNCKLVFKDYNTYNDSAGGQSQSYYEGAIMGEPTPLWGMILPLRSNREIEDVSLVQKTFYRIEFRGTKGWMPKKRMIVSVDDGINPFEATIYSIENKDMRRRYFQATIIQLS
jgi:hypothetical protein